MSGLAIAGVIIGGLALLAIFITFVWGETTTPGDGFVSEMNEAQKQR